MLGIVSFNSGALRVDELESADFQSSGFDSTRDLSDKISGDSTWLDQDECCFHT